ncbi:hypothetical protein WBP07_30145 [Novosphingobium sp. BL-8A]
MPDDRYVSGDVSGDIAYLSLQFRHDAPGSAKIDLDKADDGSLEDTAEPVLFSRKIEDENVKALEAALHVFGYITDRRFAQSAAAMRDFSLERDCLTGSHPLQIRAPLGIERSPQKIEHMLANELLRRPPVPMDVMIVGKAADMLRIEKRDQRGNGIGCRNTVVADTNP